MAAPSGLGHGPENPKHAIAAERAEGLPPRTGVADSGSPGLSADQSGAAPGFGRLARQMADWTSRLLLAGIILVAGLTFGRQVVRWWHVGQPSPGPGDAGALPAAAPELETAQMIRFGRQGWVLRRREVAGDRQAAMDALLREARSAARASAASRPARSGVSGSRSVGPEERRLLALLAERTPAERQPGRWRIYRLDEAIPMAAVVAESPRDDGPEEGHDLAGPGAGVITWAIAVPQGPGAWTIYGFQPGLSADGEGLLASRIPLPPEAERLLEVSGADGSIAAFEMTATLEQAREVVDRWAAEHGLCGCGAWQQLGEGAARRFRASQGREEHILDVRLACSGAGRTRGVVAGLVRSAKNGRSAGAP